MGTLQQLHNRALLTFASRVNQSLAVGAAGYVLGGAWVSKGSNFASNMEDRKGICELFADNPQASWGMGTSLERRIGAGHPAMTTVTHSLTLAPHILIIRLYNRDPKLKCLQEEA